MGAHLVEPGAVLADRYVVEELLDQEGASESWRARDRILARSVVVQILPSSSPYSAQLVTAAKRASRVTDTRILQVLDAVDDGELVYVVREWATGQTLDLVLSDGPLSPRRATWLMREVSAAMANAHRMGLPHRRLAPANVVLTESSGVKLIGLGTAAALRGELVAADDPELEDTLDLGRLLYACLTARWPGGDIAGLVEAPTEHGRLLRPRQVRAGVPRTLDAVCDRILGQDSHYGEPITSVSEIVDTLTLILSEEGFTATTGVGLSAPAADSSPRLFELPPALLPREGDSPPHGDQTAYHENQPTDGQSSIARTLGWSAAAVLVLGAVLLAYLIGQQGTNPATEAPRSSGSQGTSNGGSTVPKLGAIPIAAAQDFDPEGDPSEENPEEVPLAIDGDPATVWETNEYFNNPELGNLKAGVGLILDLGKVQTVSSVDITLQGDGTSLELRAAPESASTAPTGSADDYALVNSIDAAGTQVTLAPDDTVQTRFLLVWLTSLPADDPGIYRGRIADIEVFGG